MDLDMLRSEWLVEKALASDTYAQNLYAAMCNQEWQHQDVWTVLSDETWSCSWRSAGGIVADIQGKGDYMDWYCSGMMKSHPDDDLVGGAESIQHYVPEGTVTAEIREDLAKLGWHPVDPVDQ
jgi:hypothetical protein